MNKQSVLTILLLLSSTLMFSQKYTISGYVKDAKSGEAISGVNVYFVDINKGTATNTYGYYSITVEGGEYLFKIQAVGYRSFQENINLNKHIRKDIELTPAVYTKQEVVVSASRSDDNVRAAAMGTQVVNVEAMKKMPSFFGEVDVIKTIQLMPGVQSSGEGSSGFHVRGGGLDQNLVLLDEAIIYNTGHLFGFFSIFNTDAIRSAEMIKSGMSANYGGRLASVLNVNMKEGNMKKYQVEGGIGLIFARLTAQGPIVKDKASFLVSARRTYIDALIQPFLKKDSPLKGLKFYFYDLNAKTNWIINDKHRIFLSGYYGMDTYGFKSSESAMNARFTWRNASASFRWNYNISSKLFLNTSVLFSDYDFGTDMSVDVYSMTIKSGIRDYSLKSDLTYMVNANNTLKFGMSYIFHHFIPNSYAAEAGSDLDIPNSPNYFAHEVAGYANEEVDLGDFIRLNVGLRASYFAHVGKYVQYTADQFGRVQDSVVYRAGEKVKDYWGLEPRISLRFLIDKSLSIKASYVHNYQYLHQVALSSVSLPTDVWMPSSIAVKPLIGNQYSMGVYKNFKNNMIECSVEAYYKTMKNVTEYREGYSPLTQASNSLDMQFTQGDGYSYGVEFLINKTIGKFTGWIGYTLSWTKYTFPELNGGKEFFAKNDRRHDVSISLSYDILPNLTASVVWVYATGNTMTVPVGFYFMGYNMVVQYSDKNAYRVPPYHRMDIAVNWIMKRTERFEHVLNFSVYNVYNRKNPFFISISTRMEQSNMKISNQAYQMSLFPILPSISYNFKFN
ncbi:MAG: TonB-dependent receptor [Bacteroidales bacterium]|nr:TonB-dependent receptor [Bacteroidales bacterium]